MRKASSLPRVHLPSVTFVSRLVCIWYSVLLLWLPESPADILLTLESPAPGQTVSGMGTISGWAFSSSPQAQTTLRLTIDGVEQGTIPCCVDRGDVARQYPDISQSLRSGFGLLFNFNLLSDGMHTITVVAFDDVGSVAQVAERTISVTRLGGFEFLGALDLRSDAKPDFREDRQEIFIQGATVTDKETGKDQQVNFSLAWQQNTQTLGIVRSENVGEPTGGYQDDDEDGFTEPGDCNDGNDEIYPGAPEVCDDEIDNDCDEDVDEKDKQCGGTDNQQEAVRLALENPPQTVGGIGVLSGWAYTTTPNANINSLRLRIDGNLVGDIPCCSVREDVKAAFLDDQGALNSGFGAAVNFNNFESDTHLLSVEAQDSAGVSRTVEKQIQSVKLGNSDVLDQFDLSTASVSITGDASLLLEDIKIRDKASQQSSQVTVSYSWEETCQCFMPQAGCGNGTVENGEECDGATLEGNTCSSFNFKTGQLSCRPRCEDDDEDCKLPCIFETKDCHDGPRVYVTNALSNTVSVIDTGTDKVVKTIRVGKGPRGIAISPDGSVAYVSHFKGNTVSVINMETNTVTATLQVGKGPLGVVFAPDGTEVYVVNALDNSVTVIDTVTQKQETVIPVGREPQAIAVARDGTVAYITNYADNSITVLDLVAKQSSATVLVGKGPNGIAVSPDDKTVYVVNYLSDTVSILDRATTRVTATIQVDALPTRVSFAPDGKEAYVTSSLAQTISVIDTQELKVVTTLQGVSGNSPTDKPDGLVVATGGARLYVALFGDGFGRDVLVVSTQGNTRRALKTIRVGEGPFALAIAPSLGSSR